MLAAKVVWHLISCCIIEYETFVLQYTVHTRILLVFGSAAAVSRCFALTSEPDLADLSSPSVGIAVAYVHVCQSIVKSHECSSLENSQVHCHGLRMLARDCTWLPDCAHVSIENYKECPLTAAYLDLLHGSHGNLAEIGHNKCFNKSLLNTDLLWRTIHLFAA